jgi:hypothetical protein
MQRLGLPHFKKNLLTFVTSSTVFRGTVSSPGENHGKWLPTLTAATPERVPVPHWRRVYGLELDSALPPRCQGKP